MGAGLAVFMEDNEKTKKAALRLLAFRPSSESELRQRLAQKKLPVDAIEHAMAELRQSGMLDDEKFAKLYALSRIQSRPTGKGQIGFDLKKKGIPARLVESALGSLKDFDENATALELARRRHARMTHLKESVSKMRLYGFLKRRGFGHEAVRFALSKIYKNTGGLEELS